MSMILFWGILIAVMLVVELATTALVSLWFVGGGLAALLLALLNLPVWMQFLAFAVVSALLFGTCREWLEKHFRPKPVATNTGRLIQAIGTVTVPIEAHGSGRILVGGQDWKAVCENGQAVGQGELVKVVKISGVKLVVIPVNTRE